MLVWGKDWNGNGRSLAKDILPQLSLLESTNSTLLPHPLFADLSQGICSGLKGTLSPINLSLGLGPPGSAGLEEGDKWLGDE